MGVHEGWQLLVGNAGEVEDRPVPGEVVAGRVIEAGDRDRRWIDRPVARHPLDEIRVAVAELRGRYPDLRLLVPEPEDGRQRRATRHGEIARFGKEPPLSNKVANRGRLVTRAPVEEQHGRRECRAVGSHRGQSGRGHGQGDDADSGKAARALGAAFTECLPPCCRLDVRLAPVIDVGCIRALCLAALVEVRAEDADLERARPDVDGEDVATHGRRPSATSSALSV